MKIIISFLNLILKKIIKIQELLILMNNIIEKKIIHFYWKIKRMRKKLKKIV